MNALLSIVLFGAVTVLAVLAVLFAATTIRREMKALRLRKEQGESQGPWHRQPALMNALAQLLLWCAIYLNVLVLFHYLPHWLYAPILLILLGAIGLCFYALRLARSVVRPNPPSEIQSEK